MLPALYLKSSCWSYPKAGICLGCTNEETHHSKLNSNTNEQVHMLISLQLHSIITKKHHMSSPCNNVVHCPLLHWPTTSQIPLRSYYSLQKLPFLSMAYSISMLSQYVPSAWTGGKSLAALGGCWCHQNHHDRSSINSWLKTYLRDKNSE